MSDDHQSFVCGTSVAPGTSFGTAGRPDASLGPFSPGGVSTE
jgi:hypothetical protein